MERTATSATREPLAAALLALALAACEGDKTVVVPPPPGGGPDDPTSTVVQPGEEAPELRVAIAGLLGASGPGGVFVPGDVPTVRFTVTKADASPWQLVELVSGEALISGPSFNYQRVVPLRTDVRAAAVDEGGGTWRYVFAGGLPATYLPPLNDSAAFGVDAGELTGQPLLDGTYTVALSFAWDYTVLGVPYRRVGEATLDFPVGGGAGALAPRAVSSQDHCNRCHGELRAHDGRLCHTAGAEDGNDPLVDGGTPGVTIDARVMFHKIHAGRNLPSVLGVGTAPDGSRDYAAPPRPLRYARADGTVADYSAVGYPAMPWRVQPMPKDFEYPGLSAAERAKEDAVRGGVADCASCHGDPDGAGPLTTPAQGGVIYAQMTRKGCGSCHDDWDPSLPYTANGQTMDPQPDDAICFICHDTSFPSPLSPIDAHRHPLRDPAVFPGLAIEVLAVEEAGTNDGDGTLDPGEKVRVTFTLEDDAGAPIDASTLDSLRAVVAGPTRGLQTVLDVEVAPFLPGGAQPYALVLPQRVPLERVGTATAGADVFQTDLAPLLGLTAEVLVRTGSAGGSSALAAAAAPHDVFVDVLDATGFDRDDVVAVDDGGTPEYVRVQLVEGNRLWFAAPNQTAYRGSVRAAHAGGALVREVQLDLLAEGVDYFLNPALGRVIELGDLGTGNDVLVSYATDFVVQGDYPAVANASPDVDETTGAWTGKDLVSGTYRVSLTAARDVTFFGLGVDTTYRGASRAATASFLVGDAAAPEPYLTIPDGDACNACHQDLAYHGGDERGFDGCILCHGASGAQDLPRYVAANAPETPGTTVDFRTLLHRIHHGRALANGGAVVVGAGQAAYPDNYLPHAYGDYLFPAFPGRTLACSRCHGDGTDVLFPTERDHPTQRVAPVTEWRRACLGCHDAAAALAHAESQTSPAGEACAICHAAGEDEDPLLAHETR